jgi:ADP-ribosyl-[dinitrogen reductase] hydrolase
MTVKIATLVGCAIGDALGNPFEMKPAASPALKGWDGLFKAGGTFWKGNAGQYTDDTLMSIALSESLITNNGFDAEKVAQEYLAWYNSGNTRGIGSTTASAMVRLKLGATHSESGLTSLECAGNGTAMRASPLGLFYKDDLHNLLVVASEDAAITHNSMEPKMGSIAVALGVALIANGADPYDALVEIEDILSDCYVKAKLTLAKQLVNRDADAAEALAEIGTSGYVADSVGAAFYCLAACDNFKDTVIMAVRGGGDTDSIAAIAGAMAGTYYGLEGIPEEYRSVENFELLQSLTDELINKEI